jgi:hypothetical protein
MVFRVRIPLQITSPFEKGGLRGIYKKISPSPSLSKRGATLASF